MLMQCDPVWLWPCKYVRQPKNEAVVVLVPAVEADRRR